MIKAIINGLLSIITSLLDVILLPANALIEQLFPDTAILVDNFNTFVSKYLGSNLAYFFNLLPPITKSILLYWTLFITTYYGIYYSYLAIIKINKIIKEIKFW